MIRWGFFTLGAASATTAPIAGPQWAWRGGTLPVQVYPPRVRNDVWVEPGHLQSDDPALDTRDRP